MKYTIITALIMLTACSHRPHYQPNIKQIECDSVCKIINNANKTTVTIVDRKEALRQLDMPICHFEGC